MEVSKRMFTSLVFDTETTGLVKDKLPPEHPDQPRLVQLALVQLDDDLNVIQKVSVIVKPDGFVIPAQASDVHGITQEKAEKYGLPIKSVLSVFNQMCLQSVRLVAHNLKFDQLLIRSETARNKVLDRTLAMDVYCTMEESRDLVAIPPTEKMVAAGMTQYKNPSLAEAYKHFTGEDLVGAHDAIVDVMATIEVYRHVKGDSTKQGE
jgi:DNA polymerase-3 subunit epsilon